MLPTELFNEVQAVQTKIALQEWIVKGQEQDETLEEISAFHQRDRNAPQSVSKGFKTYMMEGDVLMQQCTLELVSRTYNWPGI